MQIVFHAAIRRSEGAFDIDAVVAGISDKLVHRHPHVFGDQQGIDTPAQVLAQWEQIKAKEKAARAASEGKAQKQRTLAGVKPGPALVRAQNIGNRCGKVGFDWPGWHGSFAKVEEEVREVNDAIRARETATTDVAKLNADVHAELGDLLLACVNLARKIGVDAEQALVDATHRFEQRFELVEDRLAERGKTPAQSTLDEMDALWNDVKRDLKSRNERQ